MDSVFEKRVDRNELPLHPGLTIKRLYHYMVNFRGLFYTMLFLLLLSLCGELAVPMLMEAAVNAISFSDGINVDTRSLAFSVGALGLFALLQMALGYAQERISARITLMMSYRLRKDAFQNLTRASVSRFEQLRRGDLMSRIMNDCELAAGAFTESFKEFFSAFFVVSGCAVIMFAKCVPLAAVSVGTALISVFGIGFLSAFVLPAIMRQQAALGQMNAHVEESLKAFRSCVAGGRMTENKRIMEKYSQDYYNKRLYACKLEYLMGPMMLLFGNLNFLLTVYFGVRLMAVGKITLGAIQAFIMLSRQFMEPLNALGEDFAMVQNALAGAERIFAIIDGQSEEDEISKTLPPQIAKCSEGESILACKDLHFAYHQNHPILRGIHLKVHKGERLAIVGRTGEGKTTLSSLFLLFFPHYKGQILLRGKEIRSLKPEYVRQEITLVSQEPQLVEGTIYKNLIYGCENVTREEVEQILQEMKAERLFSNLPKGLDTEIKSIGEEMSQGQMQLICLTRAVLRNTSILIMDEATASLDPETEEAVKQGTALAMTGRTCVIIAHRLSTVQDADHIAVLSDGVIKEYGTHDSLMKEKGTYYRLYEKQFMGEEI